MSDYSRCRRGGRQTIPSPNSDTGTPEADTRIMPIHRRLRNPLGCRADTSGAVTSTMRCTRTRTWTAGVLIRVILGHAERWSIVEKKAFAVVEAITRLDYITAAREVHIYAYHASLNLTLTYLIHTGVVLELIVMSQTN